ncbi:MAG: collagen-binding domain-containing protein [Clostridia bacterium]
MILLRKKFKSSICILLSLIIAFASLFTLTFTIAGAAGNEYGSISFTTPGESSSYTTYNANIYFAQISSWGGYGTVADNQVLDVTYEYADGTSSIVSTIFTAVYDSDLGLSKLFADLTSIPAACKVTVNDVQIVRDEETDTWKNYAGTDGDVILTSSDITEEITSLSGGLKTINSSEITTFEFESTGGTGSGGEIEETTQNASVQITIPNEADSTYSMSFYLTRQNEWGNASISASETYNVSYEYPDGTSQTVSTTFNTQYNSIRGQSELYLDLTNLAPGTKITIQEIPTSKSTGEWDDYISSTVGVELTSSNVDEAITLTGDSEILLANSAVAIFEFESSITQTPDETTTESTTEEETTEVTTEEYTEETTEESTEETTEESTEETTEEATESTTEETTEEATESTTEESTTQTTVVGNQYANVTVNIPNDEIEGKTYNMHLHFVRYSQWGDFISINSAETYAVTYIYLDGTSETISETFNVQYDEDDERAEIYLDLEDIPAGTIITVNDVQIARDETDTWNNYVETHTAVELTSSDPTEIITAVGETSRTLSADTTEVFEFTSEYGEAVGGNQYANVQITVPDDNEDGKTYEVNAYISRYTENGDFVIINSSEIYSVTYTYADGTSETHLTKFDYKYDDVDERSELYLELESVAAGTVITISDIQITRDESDTWNNYVSAIAEVQMFSEDITELFSSLNENPATLVSNQTTEFEFESYESDVKRETEDTFTSLGGEYTLLYLLSNYNAISFDDIEATHIVGPIIAQAGAYRTDESAFGDEESTTTTTDLVASDYSKGISSYVGTLSSTSGDSTVSSLQLGYGYDRLYYSEFEVPLFYTRSTELTDSSYEIYVQERFVHNDLVDYIILEIDGSQFVSPNDHGQALTYQSDNFIDFDTLQELMIQASYDLVEDGSIEEEVEINVVTEAITTLTITAGESWTITDASQLTTVNILLPDDYDYYSNSALEATTINIIDDTINPTYIDGVLHSQFPIVLIDGEQITVFSGENGEYGEVGNKIIWNLPNVVTDSESGYNRLVFLGSGSNIAGHILAPQAEVWNYKEYSDGIHWEGGNINGTIIAADIHSGNMEMHMWPYEGAAEGGIFTAIEVEKTFTNGDLTENSFSFELNQIEGENYDGLLNIGFPLTATTDETGIAKFQTIVFNQAGTFNFTLTEVIPSTTDNIDYDLSEYLVIIEVTEQDEDFFVTQRIYKLAVDAEGNELTELVEVEKLTYDNIRNQDLPVDYSLIKVNEYEQLLSGAVFEVYEVASPESTQAVEGGYYAEITTNTSGEINIEDLEKGKDYILIETQAPQDHNLGEGYWVISVSDVGRVTTTAKDGAADIVDSKIYNDKITEETTDIVLYKQNQYGTLLAGAEFHVYRIMSISGLMNLIQA